MEFRFRSIGIIHSPFTDKSEMPIQASRSTARGQVILEPEYIPGLKDIEGFSHLILLYVFHRSSGYNLEVRPFLDDQMHGLFATRYPSRPNPLGLSVVRLLGRQDHILEIMEVDVLDGTPLLDIKPYMPDFDVRTGAEIGWYATRKYL
jgi:tRNA-Thr(GGU) m(6)t(6)A37 methyltransferase TsaA